MVPVKKEICHVCGKEKKPYLVFLKKDIFSIMQHDLAREDGPICQRCDQYHALTGELKKTTKKEFEIAKESAWFARMMLKWWEKDKPLDVDDKSDNHDKRDWEGTATIAKWCRKALTPKTKSKDVMKK